MQQFIEDIETEVAMVRHLPAFMAPTGPAEPGSYYTRGNQPVVIYRVAKSGRFPIHGAVFCRDLLEWIGMTWTLNGRRSRFIKSRFDLIDGRHVKKFAQSVYDGDSQLLGVHASVELARGLVPTDGYISRCHYELETE